MRGGKVKETEGFWQSFEWKLVDEMVEFRVKDGFVDLLNTSSRSMDEAFSICLKFDG
jgi:hypothetical protein